MYLNSKSFWLILLVLVYSGSVFSQSIAQRRCDAFGKGQNLSNWLEASWQSGWPTENGYTKSDLEKMKEAGMQSIRLPVVFAKITDSLPPYTVDIHHPLFQRIDSVIKWCDELQLNLIIDNHHEWTLSNQHWRNQIERFSHLWSVLASRYHNLDPQHYFFELLNEPAIGFDVDSLNILFSAAIDSIRKHTKAHSIIVSPNNGSWGLAYSGYQPLPDTNLIYTWHIYDPINFTHQGLTWNTPFFPAGRAFPDSLNVFEQFLYQGWDTVIAWRDRYNLPVFLGEFGVSSYAGAESRCNWIEFMGLKLLQNNISWFYWDWRYDFPVFYSSTVSEDSVIPCFKSALQLYGDTSFTAIETEYADKLQSVSLFPNAVSSGERCYVLVPGVQGLDVTIITMTGKKMWSAEFHDSKATIPVPLEHGIYFVVIDTDNQKTVKKLVVY